MNANQYDRMDSSELLDSMMADLGVLLGAFAAVILVLIVLSVAVSGYMLLVKFDEILPQQSNPRWRR